MKKIVVLFVIILAVTFFSCHKSTTSTPVTTQNVTLDLPATPYGYFTFSGGVLTDSLNKVATLGRVLFYDTHLSINDAIACGSCHKQALGFADNAALSTGYEGMLTKRNTIAINSLQSSGNLFWDGRETNLQNLVLRPITNHVEMGMVDPSELPGKLASLPYYGHLFASAFGDQAVTLTRMSSAVSIFLQSIQLQPTRLDQYMAGNQAALTAQEIYGKYLFDTKYPCASCHNGGSFTNGSAYSGGGSGFRDIGLDVRYTDLGRGEITGVASDNGTFKVPDLHNVALTAPYMHDGRFTTLEEVVDHYNHGIQKSPNLDPLLTDKGGNAMVLNISDDEKAAIVAFLKTLTDYGMVTDPKFSNPFKIK